MLYLSHHCYAENEWRSTAPRLTNNALHRFRAKVNNTPHVGLMLEIAIRSMLATNVKSKYKGSSRAQAFSGGALEAQRPTEGGGSGGATCRINGTGGRAAGCPPTESHTGAI